MVVVDTSVWVALLRGSDHATADHLTDLLLERQVALAAPVRLELLAGTSSRDMRRLRDSLDALPLYYPEPSTWPLIESWIERAIGKGERFGFADLLIAALAAERNEPVWSLDGDFKRMARLGLVGTYRHG